jgi:hypothetical protein
VLAVTAAREGTVGVAVGVSVMPVPRCGVAPAVSLERSLDGGLRLAFVGVDPGEWVHLRRANGETVAG